MTIKKIKIKMSICNENLNVKEKAEKEQLINPVMEVKSGYTKQHVERAISSCCVQGDVAFESVLSRTNQFYIIDYQYR
jgi:hypothetical protein